MNFFFYFFFTLFNKGFFLFLCWALKRCLIHLQTGPALHTTNKVGLWSVLVSVLYVRGFSFGSDLSLGFCIIACEG